MLLISGDGDDIHHIAVSDKELSAYTGLDVLVRKPARQKTSQGVHSVPPDGTCMDHPGVVHRLSTTLSLRGINIESMETKTYSAPVSGTPIFGWKQ